MQKFVSSRYVRVAYASIILFTSLLYGCKTENQPIPTEPEEPAIVYKYVVDSTFIKTLTKTQISEISSTHKAFASYDVKAYRISYKTINSDGTDQIASGLIIMPDRHKSSDTLKVISVQHGTIRSDSEAPSNFAEVSEAYQFGSLFASMGYIIVYADYLGYGKSSNIPHPYEHRSTLASATLDMLRASQEFILSKRKIVWDDKKLFLAGYSEGGYATMSLQKKIEDEASSEFNLRASSCGAGAYDKTAFMKFIVNSPTHGISSYNQLYLWVLQTYDRIYKLNKPATYYFNEPWATRISQTGINTTINVSFNTILTDSFKKALADGTDTGFVSAIGDNDVYNWKPKTPTRLYHGDKDDLVFYFNSVNAEAAMKKQGAADVQLVTVTGGNHATSVQTFLLGTLLFFQGIN